jgi:hypothetical protein
MTHFFTKAKALLLAGTVALTFGLVGPAQAILIDFSSGTASGFGGTNSFGPLYDSYTEDNLTVVSGVDHIHLPDVGAPHGTVLRNHSDCCSTPYLLTFDVAVDIISFDYMAGDTDKSFVTNAPGAGNDGLVDTGGNWVTVDVANQVNQPLDFLNITQITWFQNTGTLKLDNIEYNVVDSQPAPVPEPSTMLLLGSGLAGIVGWRYRKQQA